MAEERTVRELIAETNRDVKRICEALKRMERRDEDFESRLRGFEALRHAEMGKERRMSRISAGAGEPWRCWCGCLGQVDEELQCDCRMAFSQEIGSFNPVYEHYGPLNRAVNSKYIRNSLSLLQVGAFVYAITNP